jgi:hypothetical protein
LWSAATARTWCAAATGHGRFPLGDVSPPHVRGYSHYETGCGINQKDFSILTDTLSFQLSDNPGRSQTIDRPSQSIDRKIDRATMLRGMKALHAETP